VSEPPWVLTLRSAQVSYTQSAPNASNASGSCQNLLNERRAQDFILKAAQTPRVQLLRFCITRFLGDRNKGRQGCRRSKCPMSHTLSARIFADLVPSGTVSGTNKYLSLQQLTRLVPLFGFCIICRCGCTDGTKRNPRNENITGWRAVQGKYFGWIRTVPAAGHA
jgi:hypothetical protein